MGGGSGRNIGETRIIANLARKFNLPILVWSVPVSQVRTEGGRPHPVCGDGCLFARVAFVLPLGAPFQQQPTVVFGHSYLVRQG